MSDRGVSDGDRARGSAGMARDDATVPASFTPWSWVEDLAVVHRTADRILRVRGKESRAWLNALLTIDLRSPAPGVARYALLLTPTGGIVSDLWVVDGAADAPEEIALVLPMALAEVVFNHLAKFHLNEEATVAFDDSIRVLTVVGPQAGDVVAGAPGTVAALSSDRLGTGGVDVWVASAEADAITERLCARARRSGGGGIVDAAWSAGRVALGVPLAGVDFDDGMSPHEAGLAGRAVSFSKGCYLGQERVARQQRQGGLRRRLVQFDIDGPENAPGGCAVRNLDGSEVGRVTSSVVGGGACTSLPALGYVNPTHAAPGVRVTLDERTARVRRVLGHDDAVAAKEASLRAGHPPQTGEGKKGIL